MADPPNPVAAGSQPSKLQPLPKIEFFAHLLHFVGFKTSDPSKFLILEPRALNPGFWKADGIKDDKKFEKLQGLLNNVVAQKRTQARARLPQFEDLRIALVDLTDDKLDAPHFAGHKHLEHGSIASSCKLSAMYAAYQLKFDLEVQANILNPKSKEELFSLMRERWALSQIDPAAGVKAELLNPSNPKLELHGELVKKEGEKIKLLCKIFDSVVDLKSGNITGRNQVGTILLGAPDLENIFDGVPNPSGGMKLSFRPDFFQHMIKMIPHSDNDDAHFCITTLGYLYINSVLWQSDLYNPKRGGGMWLGGSYPKKTKPNTSRSVTWGPAPVGDAAASKMAGSAAAIAAMLSLIEQNRLVNGDASKEMKDDLLDIFGKNSHYGSWLIQGLQGDRRFASGDRGFSKVGIAEGKIRDCVIVERQDSVTGKRLRYVMIALDAPQTALGETLFKDLAVGLDKCIQDNNR